LYITFAAVSAVETIANTINVFRRSNFTDTVVGQIATGRHLPEAALGAGVYLDFAHGPQYIFNTSNLFEDCRCDNNSLVSTYGSEGAGVMVSFGAYLSNVSTIFRDCTFRSNLLTAIGAATSSASGAAVDISFFGKAVDSLVLFDRCTISNNVIVARGSDATAYGGIRVHFMRAVISTVTKFKQCIFSNNIQTATGKAAAAYGGGSVLLFGDSGNFMASSVFDRCQFLRNYVLSPGGEGSGGAIYHEAQYPNVAIAVLQCTFTDNHATGFGAGIYATQKTSNPPANLNMAVRPSSVGGDQPFTCSQTNEGEERQWIYGNSTLRLVGSHFRGNRVTAVNSSRDGTTLVLNDGFGGALYVSNLQTAVESCSIEANRAGSGGGIYLAAGSATLLLEGSTRMSANVAKASGSAIYSASGGGITVKGKTAIDFPPRTVTGSAAPGMTVLTAGKIVYEDGALLQCAAGEILEYNMSQFTAKFDEWTINCLEVRAYLNGTLFEYVNPTCKPLQWNPDDEILGPLKSQGCVGLPLQPAMSMTTGTISCVPCDGGLYSLDRGTRTGKGALFEAHCHTCPYGANCSEGGAQLKVKAGFWGQTEQLTSGSPVLTLTACPLGYCCADHASGCPWNDSTQKACSGFREPSYPLCGGCQHGYSQTIDGVGCVLNEECGNEKIFHYMTVQLLGVWLVFDAYALHAARYPPLVSQLSRRLRPAVCNSGAVSVVVYFAQMAVVATPRGYDSLVGRTAAMAGELSMLRQLMLSHQGGTCAWEGMTMVHQLIYQLCLPFILLALLPVVSMLMPPVLSGVGRLCLRLRSCIYPDDEYRHAAGDTDQDQRIPELAVEDERAIPLLNPTDEFDPVDDGADQGQEEQYEIQEEEQDQGHSATKREQGQLWGAVACSILFSFTDFAEGTLRLLNCISISGQSVLYYAGAIECKFRWQWIFILILGILLLVPLFIVCLWLFHRPLRLFETQSVLRAFKRHATEPFRDEQWHWTAMLMLQRLLTVMCQSLSTEALTSSIGVTTVSFSFTMLQLHARPYRLRHVNDLQLLAFVCLTLLSVLNSAQSAFASAGVDAEQVGPLSTLVHDADLMMFLLLLPPPLFLLYGTLRQHFTALFQCTLLASIDKTNDVEEEEEEETNAELRIQKMKQVLAEERKLLADERQMRRMELAEERKLLADERQRRRMERQMHREERGALLAQVQRYEEERGCMLAAAGQSEPNEEGA
jgi:predicted outer membrane repeat protein